MSARTTLIDATTIGGRLRAERERLRLPQPAMAALASVTKRGLAKWESGKSYPNAEALASFANAGADVLFIVTGRHTPISDQSPQAMAGVTVRQALAILDPADRHRLLLDLLGEALRA